MSCKICTRDHSDDQQFGDMVHHPEGVGRTFQRDGYGHSYHYLDKLLHNDCGPAVLWLNGQSDFWFNGERVGGGSCSGPMYWFKTVAADEIPQEIKQRMESSWATARTRDLSRINFFFADGEAGDTERKECAPFGFYLERV